MNRNKRAFTLIELLVVIAIIAILAAILFPVFARAKDAAKRSACLSNQQQLIRSTLLYVGDNDSMMPMGMSGERPTGIIYFVHDATASYRADKRVLECPAYPGNKGGQDFDALFQFVRGRCSSCRMAGNFRYSAYTWNNGLFGMVTNPGPNGLLTLTYYPLNESQVPQPADTIAYTDGYMPRRYNSTETTGGWIDYWYKWETWARHTGAMCFAFADGHIKAYPPRGLPTGGRVMAGCNYSGYSNRPYYYDWTVHVSQNTLTNCGINKYPKREADFECVPHPGGYPNFGDFHGVPDTCIADVNTGQ